MLSPTAIPVAQPGSTGWVAACREAGGVTQRHPRLTWGSQEDLDQVLVEDERGRVLWEQVEADGGVDCKGKRG